MSALVEPGSSGARSRPPAPAGALRRLVGGIGSALGWFALATISLGGFAVARLLEPLIGHERAWGAGLHLWARICLRVGFYRLRVHGLERLERPCVLVSNHRSVFDIAVIAAAVPPPVRFVARAEILDVPVVGAVLRRAGHVIVDIGRGKENEPALENATRLLREGVSVAFFPEGTRSRSRSVGPFHGGAFRVARQAGRPLVPVALSGSENAMPRGTRRIAPCRLELQVLEPRHVPAGGTAAIIETRDAVRGAIAAAAGAADAAADARRQR